MRTAGNLLPRLFLLSNVLIGYELITGERMVYTVCVFFLSCKVIMYLYAWQKSSFFAYFSVPTKDGVFLYVVLPKVGLGDKGNAFPT